ncbi:MAG TPA: enoyl-ACP reductase FabI [Pirellulaceae bacterium]|nr:enoyl-ACP reductase FabI [Pirellulaceae bacterium]
MKAQDALKGRRALIVGMANAQSIAYGCGRALRALGAELAVTYLNDKARPHVEPLARELEATHLLPLNVQVEGQLEAVFDRLRADWGRVDIVMHSIAFATKAGLYEPLIDCPLADFQQAMDVSCHSLLRIAKLAVPLMTDGGSILTLTFHGSHRVVEGYGVMGPVKAALESMVKYLAVELGPKRIRVNALSPGPIATRAASGIPNFTDLLLEAQRASPLNAAVTIDDVGAAAAFLCQDSARHITGLVLPIDAGLTVR